MGPEFQKTLEQINAELKNGSSVVTSAGAALPAEHGEKKADAFTSATLNNNVYLPQMPVMMPPPLPNKNKKSE